MLTRSSGGTTAPSSSGTSLSVAWLFDNTTTDSTGNYNGYLVNGATYGTSTSCLQRTNATINIGSTQLLLTKNYFSGYIDNLRIVTRAKSASEILSDASLIAYYSFDLPSPNYDSGPNGLHGSSVNTASVTGRVNQAMRFIGSSSYFQAYGFYQLGYGVNHHRPFSIALWINPTSTAPCVFLQQSTTATGGSCINM